MCVGVWMCVQNKGVLILTGATLKGPFSRYDYQRAPNSGPSSVKSYKTLLPAAARDVYYRDEIGNISTSHLREDEDFIELELTPRPAVYCSIQDYALQYTAARCIALRLGELRFTACALVP